MMNNDFVSVDEGFSSYDREWWHYTPKDEPYPDAYFDFPIVSAAGWRSSG
jgi:hypothetical protein